MKMLTIRKKPLENNHLLICDYMYFAIVFSCWHSAMLANYYTTRLVCAPLN